MLVTLAAFVATTNAGGVPLGTPWGYGNVNLAGLGQVAAVAPSGPFVGTTQIGGAPAAIVAAAAPVSAAAVPSAPSGIDNYVSRTLMRLYSACIL